MRAAAVGVAVGGLLMVAAQLPSLAGQLRHPDGRPDRRRLRFRFPFGFRFQFRFGFRREEGAGAAPRTSTATATDAPTLRPGRRPERTPRTGGRPGRRPPRPVRRPAPRTPRRAPSPSLLGTVLLFALCRQSQVLIERFLASGLPSGAISHLNYAQKVAQIPMTLSLMLCTVTFPVVARAVADGDTERARARVERDVALAAGLVLLGTATVVACAPQMVQLLFQRGAFTAADTAATAGVMRVYALGLLGQTVVGRWPAATSAGRANWYPLGAMAVGIAATAGAGAWAVGPGACPGSPPPTPPASPSPPPCWSPGRARAASRARAARPGRPGPAGPGGGRGGRHGRAGRGPPRRPGVSPAVPLAAGAAAVVGVFAVLAPVLGVRGAVPAVESVRRSLRPVTRRLPHGRISLRIRFPPPTPPSGRPPAPSPQVPQVPPVPQVPLTSVRSPVPPGCPRGRARPPRHRPVDRHVPLRRRPLRGPVPDHGHAERLDAQLGWLRRRGLRGVSVAGLLAARARGEDRGLVGLTFDDGYADFVTHALPCLRRHGCGATLFVLPGRLGADNAWDPLGPRKPC